MIKLKIILILIITFFLKITFNTLKLVYWLFFFSMIKSKNCLLYLTSTHKRFWINFGKFSEFLKSFRFPYILEYECFLNVANRSLTF